MLLVLTTPWLKVLIDLWEHRGRTVVVALAIAVGVYAVGVVLNTREILVREYRTDQASALLASAVVYTSPFEDDLARSVAGLPLVAAAEGRTIATGRAIGLDGSSQDIFLTAVPDFGSISVDALSPQAGQPGPGRREVVVEGASLASLGVRIGDTLTIELDNAATRDLRVVGVVHDPQQVGPSLTGSAMAYITPETMASLGYSSAYTELRIRATDPAQDEAHIVAALQKGSAEASAILFKLSQTPHYRDGLSFSLPGVHIEIAPQCSSIRSSLALLISSLLASHLLLKTFWRKTALVLAAVLMAMIKNAIRIVVLTLLAVHVNKGWLTDSGLHQEGGIVFFILALLLLFPVFLLLRRSENKPRGGDSRSPEEQ